MNQITDDRPAVWSDEIYVRSYDVDCTGKLNPFSLFNYFQETAGNHAARLGAGYGALQDLGYFWVLSRAKFAVHRFPAWGDSVRLTTWPKGMDGVLFLRDLLLTDQTGETLVACTTGWLLLDIKSYKPQLSDVLPWTIPPNDRGHALQEPLKKLRPQGDMKHVYDRKVMLGDLDVNRHVNNARYIEWIMDCYDEQFFSSNTMKSMQVNYVGEARFADSVRLSMSMPEPSTETHYIEGTDIVKGTKVVQALIEWKKA